MQGVVPVNGDATFLCTEMNLPFVFSVTYVLCQKF